MFSFMKKYAESLAGVDAYGKIGLVIFVVVFIAVLFVAFTASKEYISEISNIPLNDSKND